MDNLQKDKQLVDGLLEVVHEESLLPEIPNMDKNYDELELEKLLTLRMEHLRAWIKDIDEHMINNKKKGHDILTTFKESISNDDDKKYIYSDLIEQLTDGITDKNFKEFPYGSELKLIFKKIKGWVIRGGYKGDIGTQIIFKKYIERNINFIDDVIAGEEEIDWESGRDPFEGLENYIRNTEISFINTIINVLSEYLKGIQNTQEVSETKKDEHKKKIIEYFLEKLISIYRKRGENVSLRNISVYDYVRDVHKIDKWEKLLRMKL